MTGDLVARLRSVDVSWSETGEWCAEAADRIEALEAKVERLCSTIEYFLNDRSSWFGKPSGYDRLRAALGEK